MGAHFKSGRNAIKRALDRRYATRGSLAHTVEAIEGLHSRLSSVESDVAQMNMAVAELQRRLRDVERLSEECARAIERVLQAELLLRRDIDALGGG